ncbi:MAG: thiazole biosynthesis protein [Crenarchaeota archaeon]|nr:thiazole biosynthesis protein [Thermoproteota archaeon]
MELDALITRTIIEEASKELSELSSVDVAIVGAGPSGMTAAKYLAEAGLKVLIVERKLSFGGGIGGGGMLFHKVVSLKEAKSILDDFGVRYSERNGLLVTDASELIAKLASGAISSGAKILLGASVEDVVVRTNPLRIAGIVVQWSAIHISGLHVDPLSIMTRAVVDATGHDASIIRIVSKKVPELGVNPRGAGPMDAARGEELVVKYTGKVVPGLYATGMAVAELHGLPRMGPIFSGMLLSGKRVAEVIIRDLKG